MKEFFSAKKLLGILLCIVILGAVGGTIYFYTQWQQAQKLLNGSDIQLTQDQVKNLVEKVGKIIDLPSSELPQVATVSDKSKLQSQQFFAKAQNGDNVFIYSNAKKAYLYRPGENKIIEVGPINFPPTPEVASASDSAKTAQVRVALYNGTTTVGLTLKVEKLFEEKEPDVTVVAKENASSSAYEKTVVVDLSQKNKDLSQKLADLTKGSVTDLPEGETKPDNTDILIILGKSYTE